MFHMLRDGSLNHVSFYLKHFLPQLIPKIYFRAMKEQGISGVQKDGREEETEKRTRVYKCRRLFYFYWRHISSPQRGCACSMLSEWRPSYSLWEKGYIGSTQALSQWFYLVLCPDPFNHLRLIHLTNGCSRAWLGGSLSKKVMAHDPNGQRIKSCLRLLVGKMCGRPKLPEWMLV